LKVLKEQCPSAFEWEKLIKTGCNLGRSRAYELLQIADGRKTVADIRAIKAQSVKKLRASSPLRSGQQKGVGCEDQAGSAPAPASKPPVITADLDRVVYKLIHTDLETARELHRLLRYGNAHRLILALERGIGSEEKSHISAD
jgi:hypothetical protein